MEDYVEKLKDEPSTQPSVSPQQEARTCAPSLTGETGKAFRVSEGPAAASVCASGLRGGPRRGKSIRRWPPLPPVEPVCLHQPRHVRRKGTSQTRRVPILPVISVYLKYSRVITTKGASRHRATDRVRDGSPQATRDRLKRNFYNFENISL